MKRKELLFKIEYGDTMIALSPEFDRALKPLKKQTIKKQKPARRDVSKPTTLSKEADEPSLKKTIKSALSGRGTFGKLPTSIGGAENSDGNSPGNIPLGVGVKKIFHDEETGKPRVFHGIVTAHNAKRGFYKVSYEDGDVEEVTPNELGKILVSKMSGTKKRKRSKAKKTRSILENV